MNVARFRRNHRVYSAAFGALVIASCAFAPLAVRTQPLQLPSTAVGNNVPIGLGYGLATVGDDGPFIIGDFRIGSEKTENGPRALAPQHARLLVRDTKGIPAFRALLAAKTLVPTLTIRNALATTTFTGVTIEKVEDAYGSAYAQVPIVDVTLSFATYTRTPAPRSSASPVAL